MISSTGQRKQLSEIIDYHRLLYATPEIESKLHSLISPSPHSSLTSSDIQRILRHSQAVFFDTHVEVVSGHHTGTYLRMESMALFPNLIEEMAEDMSQWLAGFMHHKKVDGLIVPASDARLLADAIVSRLDSYDLRVVHAPFDPQTGKIGTDIPNQRVAPGEHFIALNDLTARGNCINKLGHIITDRKGLLVGLMVFFRRDSGQFPFMDELASRYPFYYGAALNMPQWEPEQCPLCRRHDPLFSWRDMPQLSNGIKLALNSDE